MSRARTSRSTTAGPRIVIRVDASMYPMEYEWRRHCSTVLGWEDPPPVAKTTCRWWSGTPSVRRSPMIPRLSRP